MPLTYGFRGYPPRASSTTHPFTGAAIATPVLDLSSVRGPTGYADRSATGANGAPVGAPMNARGVYGDAIKFGGIRDTLNCGSNAPLDIGGDISLLMWHKVVSTGAQIELATKTNGAALGWQYTVTNPGGLVGPVFYSGGASVFPATVVFGYLMHSGFTVRSNRCRVFIDGVQGGVGTVTMTDAPAEPLILGSFRTVGDWLNGLIELPQIWNGALSPEQVYQNYLAAKDVPIYYDTFESYSVTPVAKAAGSRCGPVRVLGQTFSIMADANGKKWLMGATNGNYADGTGDWMENNAYGTWEFDFRKDEAANVYYYQFLNQNQVATGAATSNGYMFVVTVTGAAVLYRWSAGAGAAIVISWGAGSIATGTDYRIKIVRRVGGQFAMYVKGGAYPDYVMVASQATDNTYTTGQFHNPVLICAAGVGNKLSGLHRNRVCDRPASFPWEFSTGTYSGGVSGGAIWMQCVTAGISFQPHDAKPGVYEFGVFKGADVNVTDTLFCTEILATVGAAQSGYCVRLSADERLQLIRMDNGVETVLAQTAAAYVAITTEYRIKIVRTKASTWSIYIVGGAYTSWTLALGPTTDATYLQSWYLLHDLDAGDRITAPQYREGE